MDCLDENKVLQYVGGFLGPKDRQALEEHVAACDECRWMLSAAGAAVLDEVPTGEPTAVAEAGLAEGSVASRLNEVLQGTYVLERFIGRGGVGCVYEAAHRRLPRRFAVKLLDRKFVSNTNAVERLQREAEITSRLLHPNIVEVVDFNKAEDGTPFLVMELLQGESLARRLERAVLQLDDIAAMVEQVASALSAAHARGVVHRDLKPSNIFLCPREGAGPLVKVVDFGIAKVLPRAPQPADGWRRAAITRIWQVIGTPSYMSPEQALGLSAEVDHRADIFSLGAILFRMVSGSCPFSAASVEATLERVAEGRPEQNTRWREVPESLRTVILRALSKDPSQRQQSMIELWTELSSALAEAGVRMSARTEVVKQASPWMRFRVLAPIAAVGLAATVVVWAAFRTSVKPGAVETVRAKQGEEVKRGGPASRPQAAKSLGSGTTASSAPASRAAANSLRSAADREPFRPLRVRAHRFGSLVVQSKTKQDGRYLWADVFLDGRQVGQTALTLEKVPEGQHRVEVRRPGFAPAAREIRVSAGKRARVRFELERR